MPMILRPDGWRGPVKTLVIGALLATAFAGVLISLLFRP